MIPKSSRFKCCHCGWLKRKPGKCVMCRKVADFGNLMEVAWQSAGSVTSLPGELQTANTQKLREQRSLTAINSNFPVPALSNASLLDNVKRTQKPQGPGKAKLPVRYEDRADGSKLQHRQTFTGQARRGRAASHASNRDVRLEARSVASNASQKYALAPVNTL